jgi:hypothetical protein
MMRFALLILVFFTSITGFAADDVLNLTCTENGQAPNFKHLQLVTQPSGKMRARVTVAAPNSPTETYSYMVRRLPPSQLDGGNVNYRAALGRLKLSICPTCAVAGKPASFHSTLSLKTSKKAKLFSPNTRLEFKELTCSLVTEVRSR